MKRINVRTGCPYDVIIERGSLKKCADYISEVVSSRKTVIITDDTVAKLYLDDVEKSLRAGGFECEALFFRMASSQSALKR